LIAYRKGGLFPPWTVIVIDAMTGAAKCDVVLTASPYDFSVDGENLICVVGKWAMGESVIPDTAYVINIAQASFTRTTLPVTQNAGPGSPWFLRMDRDTLYEGYVNGVVGNLTNQSDICVINTVSGLTTRLWGTPELINRQCLYWTPDGGKIAFWTTPSFLLGPPWTLHLLSLDSAAEQAVFTANTYGSAVAFCPNGVGIACALGYSLSASVCAINFFWK
jgi:hypothetical protein